MDKSHPLKIPFTLGIYCGEYTPFLYEQHAHSTVFPDLLCLEAAWIEKKITASLTIANDAKELLLKTWAFSQSLAMPISYNQLFDIIEKLTLDHFYLFKGHGLHRDILLDPGFSPVMLRRKEAHLLSYLMQNPQKITKSDFLKHIWHYDPSLCTHTLETHMCGLRKKIKKLSCDPFDILCEDGMYWLA